MRGAATFKPIFKAIGPKLELSGQISAGGCSVPKSAKKSPSKSESALYIVDAHDIHTRARVCTRTTCTCTTKLPAGTAKFRYSAAGTRYSASGTRYLGTRHLVLGTRSL